jgi:hypothetical protein
VNEDVASAQPAAAFPPVVLCDGCGVALSDAEVFCFQRNAVWAGHDYLELCAACHDAARNRRIRLDVALWDDTPGHSLCCWVCGRPLFSTEDADPHSGAVDVGDVCVDCFVSSTPW